MELLNEVQQKIVDHTEGSVLVLAGAGSGKTRVLTYRIANIINKHLAYPNEILAITFTNKAAGEMRQRLATICENAQYIWAQTFHSFCARFLRNEISCLEGYNKFFSIYDENDKKMVIKKILKNHSLKDEEYLQDLMHDISTYKNLNMELDDFAKLNSYKANYEQNIVLMQEYEEVMKQNNALDFDDLMIKTLKILQSFIEIREKYQKHFKYILIDEFQDTNQVQYDLVKILAGYYKNVFAVGDEDQSIYSWRGANVKNIQKFLKDYDNTTLYKLEQNYRSTKNIIDCANKIIKFNEKRIDKTLFTENEQGVKVQYCPKFTDKEEAEFVAQEIYNLTHSLNYEYKDIAVLMRLNALTRSFEDKFLSYNIPYKIYGGLKFYERMEVKNILAYLKLLVNPQDNESFTRIVNFPKRNLGEASLAKLYQFGGEKSLMSTLLGLTLENKNEKTLCKFASFQQLMLDFLSKKTELKTSDLTSYIIKKLDLQTYFATGKEEDENRIYNLDELVSSIKQYEEDNPTATLEEYLQNISLTADIDTYNDADDTVTLATVHSAKGLEFKIVFVVGLEENYFPIIRSDSDNDDMEEERRLMYVAVTRARERLYLTNASSRYMYGSTRTTLPSRFLKEMEFIKKPVGIERVSYGSAYSNSTVHRTYDRNFEPSLSSYGKENYSPKPLYNSVSSKQSANTNFTAKSVDYTAGEKVEHAKFGKGVVVSYQKSTDILTVNFEGFGNKILSAKFANLKKI